MNVDELLARPGLAPRVRVLVAVATSVWRGDWAGLALWARTARDRGQSRQDLEEILLQAILFCGFPRVVTAFEQLGEAWPAPVAPTGGSLPPGERTAASRELFAAVYGDNDKAVRAMLRGYHEELHDFVLDAAYGRILSRPALDAATREIVAAGLLAAQDQVRQFVGHARGALRLGATKEQLREALVTALGGGADGDGGDVDGWFSRLR